MNVEPFPADTPLAITAAGLSLWKQSHEALTRGALSAAPRRAAPAPAEAGTAVIPIVGIITSKPTLLSSLMGWTTVSSFRARLAEALRSGAETILLDIDSPGGSVSGIEEAAGDVFEARRHARIIAYANGLAASAAYWIAAAANEIVATPSGTVGSIGVIGTHLDFSQALAQDGIRPTIIQSVPFKKEGTALEPLTEDARRFLQGEIDAVHRVFVENVARGRGVSAASVEANYGQGRALLAREALSRGMVDRLAASLPAALGPAARTTTRMKAMAAADVAEAQLRAQGYERPRDSSLERAERTLRESRRFLEAEAAAGGRAKV